MNDEAQLIAKLVEELILAWSVNLTPDDLSFERDKIQLLIQVRDSINKNKLTPSAEIRAFYKEVFLRDQFGGTTGKEE